MITLALEQDLLLRARRATVLEETRDQQAEPAAELADPPSLVSSSAGTPPMHAAQEDQSGRPVPAGRPGANGKPTATVAALTTSRLRSIVSSARQNHGPHRMRWDQRDRRAWEELNRRGQTA